eukprot:376762_1
MSYFSLIVWYSLGLCICNGYYSFPDMAGRLAVLPYTAKVQHRVVRKAARENAEGIRGTDKDGLLNTALFQRAANGAGFKIDAKDKLKVGIIGGGLGGLITAMDLSDAGHDVEVFEARPFVGGKVGSWVDKDGNHIEMGLHAFFGCYYNIFGIFHRLGILDTSLRLKEHTHTFVNKGGRIAELDFRFGGIGAPFNGIKAFALTNQLNLADKFYNAVALAQSPVVKALLNFDDAMKDIRELDNMSFTYWFLSKGGTRGAITHLWDAIAYALGFINCDNMSARCMLTIFQLFAVRTEASILRMLEGSPEDYIHKPILKYLDKRGVTVKTCMPAVEIQYEEDEYGYPSRVKGVVFESGNGTACEEYCDNYFDVVVAATDVPGIHKLLPPAFRKHVMFDNIYKLEGVPVATVQLRFDGWVTELGDQKRAKDVSGNFGNGRAPGLDNLLYSSDVDFSVFADLALTSPNSNYYQEGKGSLLQCVMTPGDKWMPKTTDEIAEACLQQVFELFPSARGLNCTWRNVVKLNESLYREGPGLDEFCPSQRTPIKNFYMAGSYTYQDYIDSMEGAAKSALLCADKILQDTETLANLSRAARES